jgi:ABC-type multidrug transport system ATPase subunit
VLWDVLIVKEHLEFQCRHKGAPSRLLNAEVQRVALLVELDVLLPTCARDLSGGEKRRLSIGDYFSWISISEQNFIVCSV